jgi:hypothetical protein
MAAVCAGLLYIPWFLFARAAWRQTILEGRWHFVWTMKTPLMLIRELSGGGYWTSLPLLAVAGAGLLSGRLSRSWKALLLSVFLIPVGGALAADAAFDYFLAIRQLIHALPGLVLLAAEGVQVLGDRRRSAGIAALAVLLGACLVYDVKLFGRPRENWQPAAAALKARPNGSCLVYLPESTGVFYHFFEPDLPSKSCDVAREVPGADTATVALSPYAFPDQIRRVLDQLGKSGLARVEGKAVGGVLILTYQGGATANTGGHEAR